MVRKYSWAFRGGAVGLGVALALSACGGDDDSAGGGARAGKAGSGGNAGNGGRQSSGGRAGSSSGGAGRTGGTAGTGNGGTAGQGGSVSGSGGVSGTGASGSGGVSGTGASGSGGIGGAGEAGQSGNGGQAGDDAGASGAGTGGAPGCSVPADCNDSDACTVDACASDGSCLHPPLDVDDDDACTVDSCDASTGADHAALDVDDDDACTVDDCDSSTGPSHAAVSSDDSDPCTTDACDSSTGISHTPASGAACTLSGGGTGVCSTGACVPPVCGNNAVEPTEECDGGNTDDLDSCNSKCQSEVSAGPGLALSIPDDGYDGTLTSTSMRCVDLAVGTKGDGIVDSVKLRVGISHTWVGNLVLKLVSPANTVVTLMSRPGVVEPADDGVQSGGDSSNVASAFPISFVNGAATSAENVGSTINPTQTACQDDALCVYAPAAGSATAGTLSAFVGQAAVGTWRFCVGDGLSADTGTLDFVRLSVVQ